MAPNSHTKWVAKRLHSDHVDVPTRDSMACDLMEPLRPMVDTFALRMLRERVVLKADFFERRDGNCRLMPSLTRALSATGPEWGERIAPYAEELATLLRETPPRPLTDRADDPLPAWVPRLIRTPLTGQNRTARRYRPTLGTRAPDLAVLPLARRCLGCGIDMGVRERAYCDDCRSENQSRGPSPIAPRGAGHAPRPNNPADGCSARLGAGQWRAPECRYLHA
jgi:hypothetical protein